MSRQYKLLLHKRQLEIANAIIGSKAKYHTINASRQSGKSHLALVLIIYFCINVKNKDIMVVSPVHQQNKKLFNRVKRELKSLGLIASSNGSDYEIYTTTGNYVQFRSAEKYDNIRGESIDILVVDEFSYVREIAWESAIRPVTAAKKNALVLLLSTPKGQNLFYKICMLGMSEDKENKTYKYYKMLYSDNPFYDIKEVEDARRTLPENIFKTEYLAEFIADGVVFGNLEKICIQREYSTIGTQFFGGLDFGQAVDYTVLTILNEFGETVALHRVSGKKFSHIQAELLPILEKYKPILYAESNAGTINAPLVEALMEEYPNIYPFQTTNQSKTDLVESLNLSIDEESITLPAKSLEPQVQFELSVFEYDYSPKTRRIVYSAPAGMHDDIVISVCLANKAYRENKGRTNPYAVSFEKTNRW